MNHLPIDPEEMASRTDADFIASLNMLGEGAPAFNLHEWPDEEEEKEKDKDKENEKQELPETYQ